MIGSTLTKEGRNKLRGLLQRNLDIFSWKPADMTDVPRHIAEHRLNVREGCSPVRQKKRGQAADRNQAIQEETGRWNPCADSPSNAERRVQWAITIYKWQIKLKKKIGVITSQGSFYYTKDAFRCVRLVGENLLRMVDKDSNKQIGRNIVVYVDVIVLLICQSELGRRRDVLRIQSQHQGAESMYRQGRRGLKSSIPKMLERVQKCYQDREVAWRLYRNLEHEFSEFAIYYRVVYQFLKGRYLADFIRYEPEEDYPDTLIEVEEELPEPWILFTDGFSCIDGSGAGLILTNPKGIEFTYALRFRFVAKSTTSEYESFDSRNLR
ncbi:hypothetical protein Tco_0243331 [Tanacetum coccineum]